MCNIVQTSISQKTSYFAFMDKRIYLSDVNIYIEIKNIPHHSRDWKPQQPTHSAVHIPRVSYKGCTRKQSWQSVMSRLETYHNMGYTFISTTRNNM